MPSEWAECGKPLTLKVSVMSQPAKISKLSLPFLNPCVKTKISHMTQPGKHLSKTAHTCTCLAEQFTAMSHCSSVYTNWTSVQKKSSCHQPCFKRKLNSVVEVLLLDMLLCYMYMLVVFSQVLCLTSLPSSTKTKFNKRPNNKTIQLIWRYNFVQKVFFSQH